MKADGVINVTYARVGGKDEKETFIPCSMTFQTRNKPCEKGQLNFLRSVGVQRKGGREQVSLSPSLFSLALTLSLSLFTRSYYELGERRQR